jgi:uncharacterized protein YecT (DUF1311 family)
MKKLLFILAVSFPMLVQAKGEILACQKQPTLFDILNCQSKYLDQAGQQLDDIFSAIHKHNEKDGLFLNSLDKSQKAWEDYFLISCKAIYDFWQKEEKHNVKLLQCKIDLKERRALELWHNYIEPMGNEAYIGKPHGA